MSDQTLAAGIRTIFNGEAEDGNAKRGDSYWSSNGHNVGSDVIAAVAAARHALRAGSPATLTLQESIDRIAAAHDLFRIREDDPDGFGSATFHGLRRGLDGLAAKHGRDARFTLADL